jgi:hypothetical protein
MAEVDSELLVDGDDDRGNSSSGHCSRRLELEGVATPSAEDGGAVHPLGWRRRGGRWWPRTEAEAGGSGERSGPCVRRKGNGRGSPLATPTCGDKASAHVGRRRPV